MKKRRRRWYKKYKIKKDLTDLFFASAGNAFGWYNGMDIDFDCFPKYLSYYEDKVASKNFKKYIQMMNGDIPGNVDDFVNILAEQVLELEKKDKKMLKMFSEV